MKIELLQFFISKYPDLLRTTDGRPNLRETLLKYINEHDKNFQIEKMNCVFNL